MEKNLIAKFEVNVPKTAKSLAKFVGKDELKPMLNYVCIEPERGIMTATDTHALQVVEIEVEGEYPGGIQVLVDPKHIAKVADKHVTISVFEEVREVEETRQIGYNVSITEKVNRTFRIAVIECGDETYTTETKYYKTSKYPDVMRVIPNRNWRKAIRLTAESVGALKTICKLHQESNYIAIDITEGSDNVTVYDKVNDYTPNRARHTLKLETPAELTAAVGCAPKLLATCLNGSNGVISFNSDAPQARPLLVDGEAETTILMPVQSGSGTADYIHATRANICPAQSTFAEDAAAVVAELQRHAAELWQFIVSCYTKDGKCGLTPGNYSAKDIADRDKAKCGRYVIAYGCGYDYEDTLTIKHGNINIIVDNDSLFSVLAAWESAVKCKKSVFSVGSIEEVTETVLTYTEGGAVEEKKKLRKLGGNWYCDAKRTAKSYDTTIYYDLNGVKFTVRRMSWNEIEDAGLWQSWASSHEVTAELLYKQVNNGNPYYAEVVKRIESAKQPATAAETPQISTEAAETVDCAAEGGTTQDAAYMQPYNIKYFAERFGNWQNFNKCYEDAAKSVCAELSEYHSNRRKGGSYRRRKMDALQKQLHALNTEWIQLSIVLAEYWGVSPRPPKTAPQPPQIAPTANHATPVPERDHSANKQPNSAYLTKTA